MRKLVWKHKSDDTPCTTVTMQRTGEFACIPHGRLVYHSTEQDEPVVMLEPPTVQGLDEVAREAFSGHLERLTEQLAEAAGLPVELLPKEHETSGYALSLQAASRAAGSYELKQVGWYCAGGHEVQDFSGHDVTTTTSAPESVRLEDPCAHAVPAFILERQDVEPANWCDECHGVQAHRPGCSEYGGPITPDLEAERPKHASGGSVAKASEMNLPKQ